MKKLLIVMAVIALSANSMCYAEKNWFDVELAKIRNVKELKCKIIDNEITDITTYTTRLQTDKSMNAAERQELLSVYNSRKEALISQKASIERQYKADKETLKSRWKSGNRNSEDIILKWYNDDSGENVSPNETYSYRTTSTSSERKIQTTGQNLEPVRKNVQTTTKTTTQTTRQYAEQPVKQVTTTTVTTTKQPVQEIKYQESYGPKPTVNERADLFVVPQQKTVDPSKFRVILH